MSVTIGDMIKSSLRKIGVLAAGEALPAYEGNDALEVLRQMIDSWALESLMIPTVSVVTFPLSPSFSEYTIGIYGEPKPDPLPDNHIETARPDRISIIFIRDRYSTDYDVEFMSADNYATISRKTTVARPRRMYIRNGWPLSTLLFDSVPYDGDTLHMEVVQPLSNLLPLAGLTEVVDLPPGYQRAVIYNLCLELYDEYGRTPSALIVAQAQEAKRTIKRRNYSPLTLQCDRAITQKGNIKGTYEIEGGP